MTRGKAAERALVPRAQAVMPAVTRGDELDAFQQARPDELIPPTRKLVQAVSRKADSTKAGEFWDDMANTYDGFLRVAILAMKRSRSLFDEGNFDAPPVCASDDAVQPRNQTAQVGDATTGPNCQECSFSQWGTARDGKGKGQACRLSYNLLCYGLDDGQMFILRVSGASIAPWRRYLTAGRLGGTAGYALETLIGSEQREFAAGKAYVLSFQRGDPLQDEIALVLREQAAAYRSVSLGVQEEAEVEATSSDPHSPEAHGVDPDYEAARADMSEGPAPTEPPFE